MPSNTEIRPTRVWNGLKPRSVCPAEVTVKRLFPVYKARDKEWEYFFQAVDWICGNLDEPQVFLLATRLFAFT